MPTQTILDDLSGTIEELVKGCVASGLLTHAVALYGSLDDSIPQFVYRNLPEGRDIFDLASMTKALVTTPLVFCSLRSLGLGFDVTLGQWLGSSAKLLDPRLQRLTVRSLLQHESGLPAWRNFWVCHLGVDSPEVLCDPARLRERLLFGFNRAADQLDTGTRRQVYSDVGFLLLGFCLSETSERPLPDLFSDLLQKDLSLASDGFELSFGVPSHKLLRAVPTAYCALRKRHLVGEVHDENAASLGGAQGHAGLFGTGESVAMFLHALARSTLGTQVLDRNADALVLPPGDPPNEGLLGWRQGADPSSYPFANGASMGHMGFTGVAFWVCPRARDYAILLTNRVFSGRTRPGIAALRRDVFTALAQLRS